MSDGLFETSGTGLQRRELYNDRWSAYGETAGLAQLSDKPSARKLKSFDLFKDFDDGFLETLTPDISVAKWEPGATLFEEGSYLDLAFYVVEGTVSLFLQHHADAAPQPIFNTTRMLTVPLDAPEGDGAPPARPADKTVFDLKIDAQQDQQTGGRTNITYLGSLDFDLSRGEERRIGKGEIFGEIGALNGWPQSVTARTATACTLVQIRLPALQQLKRKSKEFKAWTDRLYRERSLWQQLQTTPLFASIDPPFLSELSQKVELVSCSPGEVVAPEGGAVDALYLVRSGFLKLSQSVDGGTDGGEVVMTYLSKGMTFGEAELLMDGLDAWQFTLTSVGYTELVRIDRSDFADLVRRHPAVERRLWEATVARIKETGTTRQQPAKADLVEFALEKGLVQGNSILVMDLDVCTRCDDCVRGCASTHGGRPRFVREGDRYDNFLIARSCYHCEDPVCLIGCPTGAIRRANVGEVVEVDDSLCIGCSNCANKCPYDAIVMHDTGETWPDSSLPEWLRGKDRKVASKCDLCHTSDEGPACVTSCPHSCAFRVSSLDEFQQLQTGARA